jgi:hypothetical protein
MEAARILAQIMEGYKEIPVEQRRDHLNLMMKQVIIRNSELGSVYANWAPNALDGMDAQYSSTPVLPVRTRPDGLYQPGEGIMIKPLH